MEVKIGVQFAARELVLESAQTAEEVEKAVSDAFGDKAGVLTLEDERGRKIVVPIDKLAYVEIAETQVRRVGFSAS
ncbi:MAG: DUF3107 domain-containing protein [Terriglobales bacterium]|nr:DUF3107 domain-containing protein [Mycobacteriales bacterium]